MILTLSLTDKTIDGYNLDYVQSQNETSIFTHALHIIKV